MKSMTGYGKGMVAGDDFSVSVDLKTVNNRFLDIHLRVGSELFARAVDQETHHSRGCHAAALTSPSAWNEPRRSLTN
jgi:uncharacterized protein YicC (UPF0701 family)